MPFTEVKETTGGLGSEEKEEGGELSWISTTDISTHQDHQEPTIDHPLLRIVKLELELRMADQDAPWRLTPWAPIAITVESLDISPTSVQARNERKELASNVDRKII